MQVKISREARNDAMEIAGFIAEDNPDAAYRFLKSLEATIGRLSRYPLIGTRRKFENPDLDDLRIWPVKKFRNYLIVYRLSANALEVVRVLNSKRDFSLLFESG